MIKEAIPVLRALRDFDLRAPLFAVLFPALFPALFAVFLLDVFLAVFLFAVFLEDFLAVFLRFTIFSSLWRDRVSYFQDLKFIPDNSSSFQIFVFCGNSPHPHFRSTIVNILFFTNNYKHLKRIKLVNDKK